MNLGGATLIQPRKFAQDFIKSLKERAEVVPGSQAWLGLHRSWFRFKRWLLAHRCS